AGGPFDDLVLGPTIKELVEGGFLSPSRCFVPERRVDLRDIRTRGGDYAVDELAERLIHEGSITGDAIAQYRDRADHKPSIAFCASVKRASVVAENFVAAGYRAACVHRGTPPKIRDATIAGLGTGEVEVLTSCDLI